jgi:putative oxidoreductase
MDVSPLDIALLVNRATLGAFFATSGYHKLFNEGRHATLVSTLKADHIPLLRVMQWWVPGVEFFGGLSLLSGLLSPLAALGLFVLCGVAAVTDGLGRIPAWHPLDKADYMCCVLYLPEVLFMSMLTIVMLVGPGSLSLAYLAGLW